MKVDISLPLSQIMRALGLEKVPEDCSYEFGEEVEFDDIEIDDDLAIGELENKGYIVTWADEVREQLPLHELKDAFDAVRKGDMLVARALFDRMLDDAEAPVVEDALRSQERLPL